MITTTALTLFRCHMLLCICCFALYRNQTDLQLVIRCRVHMVCTHHVLDPTSKLHTLSISIILILNGQYYSMPVNNARSSYHPPHLDRNGASCVSMCEKARAGVDKIQPSRRHRKQGICARCLTIEQVQHKNALDVCGKMNYPAASSRCIKRLCKKHAPRGAGNEPLQGIQEEIRR